jgi:hypothetical protein
MKANRSFLAVATFVAMLAFPLIAANAQPVTATVPDAPNRTAMRSGWPPETISGTITMVDPDQKVVVIQTSDGTPYDLMLTPSTRIKCGGQPQTLQDLSSEVSKTATVKFTPERRGDMAMSFDVGQ